MERRHMSMNVDICLFVSFALTKEKEGVICLE